MAQINALHQGCNSSPWRKWNHFRMWKMKGCICYSFFFSEIFWKGKYRTAELALIWIMHVLFRSWLLELKPVITVRRITFNYATFFSLPIGLDSVLFNFILRLYLRFSVWKKYQVYKRSQVHSMICKNLFKKSFFFPFSCKI